MGNTIQYTNKVLIPPNNNPMKLLLNLLITIFLSLLLTALALVASEYFIPNPNFLSFSCGWIGGIIFMGIMLWGDKKLDR